MVNGGKEFHLEVAKLAFKELQEDHKELVKEAFKEWLDEKAAEFGKWTIKYLSMALFGATIYWLVMHGWLK
jgi:hypothetical protein